MSILSEAQRIQGEVTTQTAKIAQIKSTLAGKVANNGNSGGGSASSGSGIIDVTELPTSDIDENAVYRVTESIQTEKTEVYILGYGRQTVQEYLASQGVTTIPSFYVVDNLANMLESDIATFSAVNIYILKTDGIAYLYNSAIPVNNGIISVGYLATQSMDADKGFTQNIYTETNAGIYTTIEAFKEVVRYFIRENGEWEEITAHTEATTPHGLTNVDVYNGDITSKIPSFALLASGEITEINEEWFRDKSGVYVDRIRQDAFTNCTQLTRVTLPNSIKSISYRAFSYCDNLTTINVPWSEGEVANAPWGATNATINYNYTEE